MKNGVLIYPYWNVNCPQAAPSIHPAACFNLSILECKYSVILSRLNGCVVLIYPYWNVNKVTSGFATAALGFNLSILECKSKTVICSVGKFLSFNLSILECKSE